MKLTLQEVKDLAIDTLAAALEKADITEGEQTTFTVGINACTDIGAVRAYWADTVYPVAANGWGNSMGSPVKYEMTLSGADGTSEVGDAVDNAGWLGTVLNVEGDIVLVQAVYPCVVNEPTDGESITIGAVTATMDSATCD
jgi:hypothetical protein